VTSKLLLEALFYTLSALRVADGDPEGVETVGLLRRTALRLGALASRRASLLARHDAVRTGPFQSLVSIVALLFVLITPDSPLNSSLTYGLIPH
jgi:hypothetical protein